MPAPVPSPAPDPTMALTLSPPGLAALDRLAAGEGIDPAELDPLIAFVDARLDCADFRAATLIKILLAYEAQLDPSAVERVTASLLGFRYWMDEPGRDDMCFWSENHQLLFATVEYLAGRRWPDRSFSNAGLTGAEHAAKARARLLGWLENRFRFGFSEWLSNTYYEEDVAGLALLIDHAEPEVADRARVIMDLIMLDLAAHNFRGRFVASSGRCYESQKRRPETADVNDIMHLAFGFHPGTTINYARMSGLFAVSSYRPGAGLVALAHDEQTMIIKASQGLELDEVRELLGDDVDGAGLQFWAMEAFTTPESIRLTMRALERFHLAGNAFLAPLARFARVPRPLLPALVRLLNPATQGLALRRASVYTWRSRLGLLSAAQRHHPRGFGDQQHIWQATLPGDVSVFATHPAGPMFDDGARNSSPSAWVGNGRNPDVAQDENVLVARYDTTGRRGYLEAPRQPRSHLHWPADRFDEQLLGERTLVGRAAGSLIGVRAARPLTAGEPDEIVQAGAITGWAVVIVDAAMGAERLFADLEGSVLAVDRGELRFTFSGGAYRLSAPRPGAERRCGGRIDSRGAFSRDGKIVDTDYHRFDASFARAVRLGSRMDVDLGGRREAWTLAGIGERGGGEGAIG